MKYLKFKIILFFILGIQSFGQIENLKTHSQMSLDCKKCHICDTPTKANPCLVICPRNKIEVIRHLPEEGPEMIILDEITSENDLYQSVKFTHKLHAEMSLMAGGCSSCHHFNPPGKIVKCISCHEPTRIREALSVPDLKAAYHRQCMGCHQTWEKKTKCESCHLLNTKKGSVAKKESIENVHPKILIPNRIVYETESEKGKIVTFFHNDHSSLFGFECSDCHTSQSCSSCHSQKIKPSKVNDEHVRCSKCHETEKDCKKCHQDELAQPFNHLSKTGFALTKYHAISNCALCHKDKNNFSGLKKDCIYCHKNSEGLFKHSITGIILDEIHSELECLNCHLKNDYSIKPSCIECHDDMSFPANIPGDKVN